MPCRQMVVRRRDPKCTRKRPLWRRTPARKEAARVRAVGESPGLAPRCLSVFECPVLLGRRRSASRRDAPDKGHGSRSRHAGVVDRENSYTPADTRRHFSRGLFFRPSSALVLPYSFWAGDSLEKIFT